MVAEGLSGLVREKETKRLLSEVELRNGNYSELVLQFFDDTLSFVKGFGLYFLKDDP